ncbi:MAG: GNAT family N-acetyltransferase [Cyclobacteriaceae bacterium]
MYKEKPIHIRLLALADLSQLYYTFLEAFSDYSIDMSLGQKAFERRMLNKLSIEWPLSVGAFSGDKMVGFIVHTSNNYQNERHAYNGGTGVIPEYRGLNLTEHMYGRAIRQMQEQGIQKCVLEVIDTNSNATKAYQKVGFQKKRILRCYKLVRSIVAATNHTERYSVETLDTRGLEALPNLTIPSFMDTWAQLTRNSAHEKMLRIYDQDDTLKGYAIFQPDNGRIARLWVRDKDRRNGIGRSLLSTIAGKCPNKSLTVINVDENDQAAHQFLIACGFENQINQWEMILEIH